jgi:hypothetical protein
MEQASVFFSFTLKKFTEKSRELQSTGQATFVEEYFFLVDSSLCS